MLQAPHDLTSHSAGKHASPDNADVNSSRERLDDGRVSVLVLHGQQLVRRQLPRGRLVLGGIA